MKIFLIGFMGCGKTTIGRRLAARIGFDFVDTDHFIEMRQGLSVSEIFNRYGETAFRALEHNILSEIQKLEFAVVSTGGGMPCNSNHIEMMHSMGTVVYLKASSQVLTRRILRSRTERPLIKGKNEKELQQYITEKLVEREPFYNRAHIVLETVNFSMDALLQSLNLMKT